MIGPRGVTVHTICPGPADTPRLRLTGDHALTHKLDELAPEVGTDAQTGLVRRLG